MVHIYGKQLRKDQPAQAGQYRTGKAVGKTVFPVGKYHKKRSEQHYLAGKMYAHAKLEVDSKIKVWELQEVDELEVVQYFQNYFSGLNELVQIPENKFTKLKHAHQTKVEFSKFLDTHKRDYLWICKCKFRFGQKS